MKYTDFIKSKTYLAKPVGIEVEPAAVHPVLYPHQRDVVLTAIRAGRYGVFARFGLGKTIMALELCRLILLRKGGRALIVMPLGVTQEFRHDAKLLGITIQYVRNDAEIETSGCDILITNYERVRDGNITPEMVASFTVTSLDEAAVLRSYGSKTYQEFLPLFADVPYRYVFTATPAPNRYKEIIHYAAYLGVMDSGQALTRFFQRDSTKANSLTLYPHMEDKFWLWVSSWSTFLTKPSDLGYDDSGYDLPEMNITWHEIQTGERDDVHVDRDGQQDMMHDASRGLSDAAKEKRYTMDDRIAKAKELLAEYPDEHALIWHHLEDERKAIAEAIPESLDVYGTQDMEERERRVIGFSEGEIQYLSTKPEIAGSGCNFQRHCRLAIFVGIDYKFNDLIQAVHRIYRFQQTREVHVHIIYADTERAIKDALLRKWKLYDDMVTRMVEIIHKHGLGSHGVEQMRRAATVARKEVSGDGWRAIHNDCVLECERMDDNSVDLIVTSIPFGNHYEYSPNYLDFGHNPGNDEFFRQMGYLTPHLLRVLKPGRLYCCHVKDRILFASQTGDGAPTLDPFHCLTVIHGQQHGFVLQAIITIETDVVRENNQTYRLGWSENCKDGTKMGVGCPEYLLIFRKRPTDCSKGYADLPVSKSKDEYMRGRWQIDARAKWNSDGNRFLSPEEIAGLNVKQSGKLFATRASARTYSYREHVEAAETMERLGRLPAEFQTLNVPARYDYVWSDVTRMKTMNELQAKRKQEKHICPLQFDIVDRCIFRFSNQGETVLDPFGGLMTVPYRAILAGRHGIGVELNEQYWKQGCAYMRQAEMEACQPTLFEALEVGA